MDITRRKMLQLAAIGASTLMVPNCGGGSKSDSGVDPYASIDEIKSDLNSISILFKEKIDPSTVSKSSVTISDNSGDLNDFVVASLTNNDAGGSTLTLSLREELSFKYTWAYYITISPVLKNVNGDSIYSSITTLDHITDSIHPHQYGMEEDPNEYVSVHGADAVYAPKNTRYKFFFISDLHLNIQDATDHGYASLKNYEYLLSFLTNLKQNTVAAELVILGDFLDNWIYPYYSIPDPPDVHFANVIDAPVNQNVVKAINAIADDKKIKVTYVRGNHDMQLSKAVFNKYFPNVNFVDSKSGLYSPGGDKNIICEHGHRYDFMCAPIEPPLSSSDTMLPQIVGTAILPAGISTILPVGYYNSRMNTISNALLPPVPEICPDIIPVVPSDPVTFALLATAWGIMIARTKRHNCFCDIIQCDGYSVSVGNVPGMYWTTANTVVWAGREYSLGITNPLSYGSIEGLLNSVGEHCDWGSLFCDVYQIGSSFLAAKQGPVMDLEHSSKNPKYYVSGAKRIAVAGHTHIPTIETYYHNTICSGYLSFVYANSGTWLGGGNSFVVVSSAPLHGSDAYEVEVREWTLDEGGSVRKDPLLRYNTTTGQPETAPNPVKLNPKAANLFTNCPMKKPY